MAVNDNYDTYLPTLGIEGWLSNPQALVEKIFFYYVASYGKQSNMFYGEVYSLLDSIKRGESPAAIRSNISQDLLSLYSSHYPKEDVSIEINIESPADSNIVSFYIDITITKDSKKYTLKETLQVKETNLINYQTVLNRLKSDVIE